MHSADDLLKVTRWVGDQVPTWVILCGSQCLRCKACKALSWTDIIKTFLGPPVLARSLYKCTPWLFVFCYWMFTISLLFVVLRVWGSDYRRCICVISSTKDRFEVFLFGVQNKLFRTLMFLAPLFLLGFCSAIWVIFILIKPWLETMLAHNRR